MKCSSYMGGKLIKEDETEYIFEAAVNAEGEKPENETGPVGGTNSLVM